ncbi:MAG: glycerol-3-phosphate acyltransferase [Clostridia bacterium]
MLTTREIFLILLAFFSGTLPFSFWLGKFFAKTDIRTIGDKNPGSSNVFRTGHLKLGIIAIVLDFAKGLLPVIILAPMLDIGSIPWIAVAIAPVFGHAFSPFLHFRGGKAVAVTFGIWTALTLWIVPSFLGVVLAILYLCFNVSTDGWKVMLGLIGIAIPLLIIQAPFAYWLILVLNIIVVGYKHRSDLTKPLRIAIKH